MCFVYILATNTTNSSMYSKLGAQYRSDGHGDFTVWSPKATMMKLVLKNNKTPIDMHKDKWGYWSVSVEGITPGDKYNYMLEEGQLLSDPASFYQPEGVHGSSQIIDPNAFKWTDCNWATISLDELIIYELHIGTFTNEGTFDAALEKLDHLVELGINAIELMPISQFPGKRNWGYDISFPFAIQNSYGGPEGLKRFLNACHNKGIAVILDAVYNHLGPEGNYMLAFGPYHTDKYVILWGSAINFDDEHSDGVRNFYIQNALMLFEEYHVDALRLDAVHAYKDSSAVHFMQELSSQVKLLSKYLSKPLLLIGECDLNEPSYILPVEEMEMGLHAQWCDEYHYTLHALPYYR